MTIHDFARHVVNPRQAGEQPPITISCFASWDANMSVILSCPFGQCEDEPGVTLYVTPSDWASAIRQALVRS